MDTVAVILIVLWLLGMVSGYTFGGAIYLLPALAVVLIIAHLAAGRAA